VFDGALPVCLPPFPLRCLSHTLHRQRNTANPPRYLRPLTLRKPELTSP
jgi:hypothetical protein